MDSSLGGYSALPYLLIALSLGMGSAFFLTEMPFLMRNFGISLESIGWYSTASVLPYVIQPFFNPMTDMWMRRKVWFVCLSISCSLSIIAGLHFIDTTHRHLFYVLILFGQVQFGLATSCYGGLAATSLDKVGRLKASNLLNIGAQAGGAIGATALLMVTPRCSVGTLSLLAGTLIAVPALSALWIYEPARLRRSPRDIVHGFIEEARQTMSGKDGWIGIILCLCPAGTIALNFFLPALALDYHAPEWMTVSLNGFAGWILTLIGMYVGGQMCVHRDSRIIYIVSAVAMALVGIFWAIVPISPASYAIGSIVYCVVQGASLVSCSAMVFELISRSSTSSSTQYSIFYAFSAIAQMYVLSFDTHVYARHGLRSLYVTDAGLNLVGAVLLLLLLRRWGRTPDRKTAGDLSCLIGKT